MIDHIGLHVRDVARATEILSEGACAAWLRHRHAGLDKGDQRQPAVGFGAV